MLRLIISSALLIPICFAAGVTIEPIPATQEQLNSQNLEELKSASVKIDGEGTQFNINYSAPSTIDLYILFMEKDGTFNPRNILFAELPQGEQETIIPISDTGGWSRGNNNYKLHFLTDKDSVPEVSKVELSGNLSIADGIKQFFAPEPFTPSSYHRLNGYKLFGYSATFVLLILTLIGSLIFIKNRKVQILIFLGMIFISNARFSIDSLRYTYTHLTANTYASAGSAYEIAEYLHKNDIENIALCSDGNSYFKTVLSYALYPAKIKDESENILVHSAFNWSFENDVIRCGETEANAIKLNGFPDGSVLFSL
ncbi:hypothetical protein KJ652_02125 [Patescibacteria group bacterium]|nr:hypothetical protein [Patescibacteria group bacterium]MBU1123362.1 hypothetical protein [Patescibacteria group bacterium]MBU1911064.1 hypothetical protein [Patescibacteria group bacterium]